MKYKKPRTINWVTFALLLGVALVVYVSVCLWPVYTASARAKGILWDHVPALYRANLRDDDVAHAMIEDIKTGIENDLRKAGINDKAARIIVHRDPKEIAIEVRFKATVHFPVPERTFEIELSPRVTSDATRVDW
jgi:hypothetical protein